MTDTATTTVDTYLAMWNEEDAARRAELITSAWSDDCRYADPLLEAAGHDGLSEMVAGVHRHYPGARFRRTSAVDGHHDEVRFGWELVAADGSVVVAGIDIGRLADDGRLRSITGFFGELAAVEEAAA
jgi:hypothetical protein